MKTLMVLGGGIYQLPLIRQAKEMGLRVIVVTYRGNYPGIPLADIFLDLDTTDYKAVGKAAAEYKIDGIITTGTDVCVPTLGYIVDALHLTGPSYDAACKSMNKILMKKAFQANGVRTAGFGVFSDCGEAEAFAEKTGYPVMVKAPDSSGSRGITRVSSSAEFASAWDCAAKVSKKGEIIVEQYLEGKEFGAQAFIQGDEVVAVFPHGDTVTPPPHCTPVGHSVPAGLSESVQEDTRELICRAAGSLGLRNCIANVDLMLVQGKPYILEIGARMGATCLPENISIYAGQNVYEYLIRLALGESVEFRVQAKQPNACLLLRSPKTGILKEIRVPEHIRKDPALYDLHLDVIPGEKVRKFTVGPDRIGHVIVLADTAEHAESLAEKFVSEIEIEVEDE